MEDVSETGLPGAGIPHRILDNFLSRQDHGRLLAWAIQNQSLFVPSRTVGRGYDPAARSSFSLERASQGWWLELMHERAQAVSAAGFGELGVKPFAASKIEFEMTAYGDGAFFLPHLDTLTGPGRAESDRMVSGVYYFFKSPKAFAGGALRLHRFGTRGLEKSDFIDISPRQNSLVLFPSWLRHEVRPVACPSRRFEDSRFAINCWFHRAVTGEGTA